METGDTGQVEGGNVWEIHFKTGWERGTKDEEVKIEKKRIRENKSDDDNIDDDDDMCKMEEYSRKMKKEKKEKVDEEGDVLKK